MYLFAGPRTSLKPARGVRPVSGQEPPKDADEKGWPELLTIEPLDATTLTAGVHPCGIRPGAWPGSPTPVNLMRRCRTVRDVAAGGVLAATESRTFLAAGQAVMHVSERHQQGGAGNPLLMLVLLAPASRAFR
jgi:hypothetical protein